MGRPRHRARPCPRRPRGRGTRPQQRGHGDAARLRPAQGLARLQQSLDLALAHDLHEHAARAYTNLGACLGACSARSPTPTPTSPPASPTATDRDLDSWRTYMTAWLADSACQQGRFDGRDRLAEEVLRRPRPSIGHAGSRRWWSPGTVRRTPRRPAGRRPARRGPGPRGGHRGGPAHRPGRRREGRGRLGARRPRRGWPRSSRASARSSTPTFTALGPGRAVLVAAARRAEVLADVEVAGPFRLMLDRPVGGGGHGVGGPGLPVVAGGEPGPRGVPRRRPPGAASCSGRWAPRRPVRRCSATGTRPGCPCRGVRGHGPARTRPG